MFSQHHKYPLRQFWHFVSIALYDPLPVSTLKHPYITQGMHGKITHSSTSQVLHFQNKSLYRPPYANIIKFDSLILYFHWKTFSFASSPFLWHGSHPVSKNNVKRSLSRAHVTWTVWGERQIDNGITQTCP